MSNSLHMRSTAPEPRIEPDSVYLPPGRRRLASETRPEYHVFLITGNPGMIGYYRTFLGCLAKYIDEDETISSGVHLYGHSLGGFEISNTSSSHIYGLQQQIEYVENTLQDYIESQKRNATDQRDQQGLQTSDQQPLKVILIGHSAGAYISLELIRRHRERFRLERSKDLDIVGGVLLFPTVMDIAKSPTGVKVGVWGSHLLNLVTLAYRILVAG